MKLIRTVLVSLLSFSLILMPVAHAAELALPSGDLVAPVIEHTPIAKEIPPGQPVDVKATVTDNVGVKEVILFYREIDTDEFKRMKMKRDLDSDTYTANLPVVASPGLEYYIQATDLAGNTLLFGHSFSPLTISVAADGGDVATVAAVGAESSTTEKEEKTGISKWVWIGLGAVAVGALAAGGGGSGGGGGDPIQPASATGTVVITGPPP